MQCIKIILKQSQTSKQIILKYGKGTLVLCLVAHIQHIFISTYHEEII